ncbi:serine hydrolase-like protein [Galleria mellonella]|uniref:Serine hydrolase-like protein n=1 Tax=Galleria mellonella TaxID=7137 RepID=A0ABM3MU63_GALME|nr:serine hydrolase-like protein [Galleria mellonella]
MSLVENEWYIEAPWGKLCVVAWGDCTQPPVLLVHGMLDSAATFRPLVSLLPDKFYYVAIELPGNGKSDRLPPGMMINVYDLVYCVALVIRHFRWEQVTYIGHSLGCHIGMIFNACRPGVISKLIELDPMYRVAIVLPSEFSRWYRKMFTSYYENYEKYNAPKETAPTYTVDEALRALKETRGLTQSAAAATLERLTERLADGRVRFTYDQRFKLITLRPFSPEEFKAALTKVSIPILAVLCKGSVEHKGYEYSEFIFDEGSFPEKNYRARTVEGGHDTHFNEPKRVAPYVSQFLVYGLEGVDRDAKL